MTAEVSVNAVAVQIGGSDYGGKVPDSPSVGAANSVHTKLKIRYDDVTRPRSNQKFIRPSTAGQCIVTAAAINPILITVANNDVGKAVTGSIDVQNPVRTVFIVARPQCQVLDVCPQRIADFGFHRVGALVRQFNNRASGWGGERLEDVSIIVQPARHCLRSVNRLREKRVVARPAVQYVGVWAARNSVVATQTIDCEISFAFCGDGTAM